MIATSENTVLGIVDEIAIPGDHLAEGCRKMPEQPVEQYAGAIDRDAAVQVPAQQSDSRHRMMPAGDEAGLIDIQVKDTETVCNSLPGIEMTAEVLCGLGIFGCKESHGEVDAAEANCGPHGPEAAGGEAVETAVLDLGDETMAADFGNQA